MKALSLWQPWAWLCCTPRPDNPRLPIKDVENRSWHTDFRGRIYIHAARKVEKEAFTPHLKLLLNRYPGAWAEAQASVHRWKEGAIIGEVDIVDVVDAAVSPWAVPGHAHWLLANPRRYELPIPYHGSQRLFEVKL